MNSKGFRLFGWLKLSVIPWAICFLAMAFYCYDFLLRVMPSVMIHPLMNAYRVNAGQIGLLSAFYYYTYTPLQLPAGVIADKYKPRVVLGFSCLLCALGALLFAATDSFVIACISRAMMGAGSAFAFVGALKLAAIWLPENRFALFAGLTTSIGTLGAVTADNFLSSLVATLRWQHAVYLTGIIGMFLSFLLFLFLRRSQTHKEISSRADQSWKNILKRLILLARSPYIWLNGIIGAFMFLPISVFASLWGVDFLERNYNIPNTHAASATSLVFLGLAITSPFIGYLSDLIQSRKIPLFIGCLGCVITSYLLIYVPNISLSTAYVLLFLIGMFTSPQALIFAISKDLSPPLTTGISTAMANFIVTIGAGVYQPVIGFILDSQWNGTTTALGTPIFSTTNFQFAFSTLIISLGISLVLILFLPKYNPSKINIKD